MSRPPVEDFAGWLREVQRRLIDLERRPVGGGLTTAAMNTAISTAVSAAISASYGTAAFTSAVKNQFSSSEFASKVQAQFTGNAFTQAVKNVIASQNTVMPRTVRVTYTLNKGTYTAGQSGNFRINVPGLLSSMSGFCGNYGGSEDINNIYPFIYNVQNGYFDYQWRVQKTFDLSADKSYHINFLFTPVEWHALNVNGKGTAVRSAVTYDTDIRDNTNLPPDLTFNLTPRSLANGHVDGQTVRFTISPTMLHN